MDYEKLFPGRFLKSADLPDRGATLEIKAVRSEEIDGKPKAVLSFQRTKKEMVMNRTNAESIKLMFGRETDGWVGKHITIFPATIADPFNGGSTKAIRKTIKVSVVPTGKAAKPNGKRQAPPEPEPQEPPPHDEETGELMDGEGFPEGAEAL